MSEEERNRVLLTQDQVLEILETLIHKLDEERQIYAKHNLSYTVRLTDFGNKLTQVMTSVVIATVNDSTVVIIEGSKH
jgi:hypothetical protein